MIGSRNHNQGIVHKIVRIEIQILRWLTHQDDIGLIAFKFFQQGFSVGHIKCDLNTGVQTGKSGEQSCGEIVYGRSNGDAQPASIHTFEFVHFFLRGDQVAHDGLRVAQHRFTRLSHEYALTNLLEQRQSDRNFQLFNLH